MTKYTKEFQVKEVAKATGVSQDKVAEIYETLIDVLRTGLKEEGKVILSNFGTFNKGVRAEHNCRNPKTGETMTVPAHNVVKFHPIDALKKQINE